ncbi:cation-transporting P-type ATPase [Roseibium salinum]|nr:cation-transporting P-type ATPase [Roseibium salinum]
MESTGRLEAPYARDAEEIAGELETRPSRGLSSKEASRRRQVHGPNQLRGHETRSALAILAHQFASIIVWLLCAAAVMSLVLGDVADAVAIAVVLILNGAIGFFSPNFVPPGRWKPSPASRRCARASGGRAK